MTTTETRSSRAPLSPDASPPRTPPVAARPVPLRRVYRFELTKLVSQWRTRIMLIACCVGPGLFVAVVSQQTTLPTDTVFGRWLLATGWAGALVVLGFCCSWVLPLATSLVAGDVFAAEDRLGTWRHLLMAVRSPRRVFVAKSLASLTVIVAVLAALGLSATVGGLLAVGNHPLVGLDGHALGTGDAARTVLLAWLSVLAPTLAFAGVGLLGSVVLGRSPMGLLVPALLAVVLGLVEVLPLPEALRLALPTNTLLAWRGLFTAPAQTGPLLISVAVSLTWAVAATLLAYAVFVRRDFTDLAYDGAGRRALGVALPLVGLVAATAGVIAVATPATGTGVTQDKLEGSLATSFAHLYQLQSAELHRPGYTVSQLGAGADCDKGGSLVEDEGPGNDWRCVVTWHVPGSQTQATAVYQLDVTADGRYVADGDGPQEVNGYFVVHTPTGDAPNPLWQLDGIVDLLKPSSKG
ncbi:ABC transporter permease [Luteimicrobium subarcticum]|uniref:ABC-2 type transport system permease protein n=1 Tax=Luteimicrobium subarcticum TaxID=620910 RepID=A0A2M8WR56_9MICO|nr:ABC transporter permease [Luteimicrobium subarcticum]PJI93422.1 ABC-2 type transport system permease protein [Luteimicrobium subarcticum]